MKKDPQAREPLRLGVIGAGLAVRLLHWPALQRLPDQFTLVQICDVDRAAAEATAAVVGPAPLTTDYHEVLRNPQVEAVLLALPIHLNAPLTLEAAQAGKHVICEKPLAASLEQGRELVRALAGLPVVVATAENYHFRPDLAQARAWMDAGRIGRPFLISSQGIYWTDITRGFGSTPWRQDSQYRGAVIADAGVHNAAGLRALGGEVEQLQAFVKDVHPVMSGPDSMVLNLRFRNGLLGHLTFTGAARAADSSAPTFQVLGTEGTIVVARETRLLGAPKSEGEAPEVLETFQPGPAGTSGYYEEFQDFYDAVRAGRPPRVPPAEALRDWEIIARALDSAESTSVIRL